MRRMALVAGLLTIGPVSCILLPNAAPAPSPDTEQAAVDATAAAHPVLVGEGGTAPVAFRGVPDAGVNGRLPPEVIQTTVRASFGMFRRCYEDGMSKDPKLKGRVTVKFIIDERGHVPITADAGSDIPDQSVVTCVVRAFGTLSFPPPQGGHVTVVYPIMFNPGD